MIIDDFFERGLSEAQVCDKHGLTVEKLREWCQDSDFKDQVFQRLFAPVSQAWIMLARSAPKTAQRLIELTDCEKPDIARKACLDILTALPWQVQDSGDNQSDESQGPRLQISDREAVAVMKALANERRQIEKERRDQHEQMRAEQRQDRTMMAAQTTDPDNERQ
jgi:hypothetical protein